MDDPQSPGPLPQVYGHSGLIDLDDDEEEAVTRCLQDPLSQRMSRLGRIKRFSRGISSRVNSRIRGFSSRLNTRVRQLQQRRPKGGSTLKRAAGSTLKKVTQKISGRFRRQLAWQSLEADEQLTAMRLASSSRPLAAIFAHPCFQCLFGCWALAALATAVQSYAALIAANAVRRYLHYRCVPEVPTTQLLGFGVGCWGLGCGASVSQVPQAHGAHTTIAGGLAQLSHEAPFPANLFFVVVPPGPTERLTPFVVEGSLDGRVWDRLWPGAGPWGEGPPAEEGAMRPQIRPNSVDEVDWFSQEACWNGTGTTRLGADCRTGVLLRKDLHLYWHHHVEWLKRLVASLALWLASVVGACGRPQLARPTLLTGAFLYGVASVALALGKLLLGELSNDWAESIGVLIAAGGISCCESRLFFFLSLGTSIWLALVGARGLACEAADLESLTLSCQGRYVWQAEIALALLFALSALTVRCVQRPGSTEGKALKFPPPGVFFLGAEGTLAKQELLAFAVIRSIFGMEERDYRRSAHKLLSRVVSERKKSTAKSGALMAFGDSFMVKSMTAMEASTLLAILRSYLNHLESHGGPNTMLPRFYGAYIHVGWLGRQTILMVMANVFADVPPEVLGTMERFDLKGSSDDRSQRHRGAELMDFDLLREDRKLVPADDAQGEEFCSQLCEDIRFLLAQHMPVGPCGVLDYESLPDSYRGAPGLMDYSLLVGVVPRGTPGGIIRLDVRDERLVRFRGLDGRHCWDVQATDATVLVGVIDILQFWTPTKRAARLLKKGLGKERDLDGGYHGEILDTVKPELYSARFLAFMGEVFSAGSWVDSLPRLYGGDWSRVTALQICQLPESQREEALECQRAAVAEGRRHRSDSGRFALG